MVSEKNLIPVGIITGTTASGKTSLAIELALSCSSKTSVEIINADSLLIYRGMDTGTAKPSLEERKGIPHHLIDIRNPDEVFTAGDFKRAVNQAIEEIHSRGNRALIVGGTGFYLKALLFGLWEAPKSDPEIKQKLEILSNEDLYQKLADLDPIAARRISLSDRYRLIRGLELIQLSGKTLSQLQDQLPETPDPRFHLWVVDRESSELFGRIHLRTQQMLANGLIDEFQKIHMEYPESRALQAIGYAQVKNYLDGRSPEGRNLRPGIQGLEDEINLATRQLVKRQRTWFKNQLLKTPQGQLFTLEDDRILLEQAFQELYFNSHT